MKVGGRGVIVVNSYPFFCLIENFFQKDSRMTGEKANLFFFSRYQDEKTKKKNLDCFKVGKNLLMIFATLILGKASK